VIRWLGLAFVAYLPHLVEEHFTKMYDDPILVSLFLPLASLPARQSAYLVFQAMLTVALAMTYLFSLGGRAQEAVMVGLAVGLVAESHHVVRWMLSHSYNSGLLTSFPMPVLGLLILRVVFRHARAAEAGPAFPVER
jgi:Protein of unknown function with HXXEE motif